MRSRLASLLIGFALATTASAHTADDAAPMREAGVLACHGLAETGLVFGRARPAACRFVAADGSASGYAALLPPGAAAPAGLLVWRVRTAGGQLRPGLLDGAFEAGKGVLVQHDGSVALEPVGDSAEPSLLLAAERG